MILKTAEKSVFRHFIYNLVYAISRVLRELIKGARKNPQRRHKEREHPIECSLVFVDDSSMVYNLCVEVHILG